MVFTFIMVLSPQTFIPGLAKLRIAFLTGGFAVAAHLWNRFMTRQPLMRMTREVWLAAGLLGWAVVTLPVSIWPSGSLGVLLDLYLKALIIFWLLSNTVTTPRRLRVVAWGFSLMAIPLAITGLRHFASHQTTGRIIGYEAGLTGNPNDLALMLNLILPLTIALFLINRRPGVRALLAGIIALDASGVIVTYSRTGFLALAAILVLYFRTLRKRGQMKWAIAALVLMVIAVPLLPSGYMERLGTIGNIQADRTGSAQERFSDAGVALAYVLSHPLAGAGLGNNILAMNDLRGAKWLAVHNVYLELAVDLGWPGLVLFVLLLVSCIRTTARVSKYCAGVPELRDLSALSEAIRIMLVAFAVAAFFHPVAYNFYFYYVAGLAVATGALYEVERQTLSLASPHGSAGDVESVPPALDIAGRQS